MGSPLECLVEGKDDQIVLRELLEQHKAEGVESWDVIDKGGVEALVEDVRVRVLGSEIKALAVVLDADNRLAARWQSLADRLRERGYENVPQTPDRDGLIMRHSLYPPVGVWFMPDNEQAGMLEDFLASLILEGDSLWPRAVDTVKAIPPEHRRFKGKDLSKAHIHTWLAWQKDPGRPFGSALKARYLDAKAPAAKALIGWLRRLAEAGRQPA